MTEVTEISSSKSFGGYQRVYTHMSVTCKAPMKFSLFVPPRALESNFKCPVIYFLSGRGCSEQNFISKSGFQRYAAEHGLVVVGPDTSPRNVIEGEGDEKLVGVGVSYYVDAATTRWSKHYQMFSYVTEELIKVVESNFSFVDSSRRGIFGHSMGGHGALLCAIKCPGLYQSVSALAPVTNIINSPRQVRVLQEYFGDDEELWRQWDPTELLKQYEGPSLDVLMDIGTIDEYLHISLLPWNFVRAVPSSKVSCTLRLQEGYDHGYNFISTFVGDHIVHHAKVLNKSS